MEPRGGNVVARAALAAYERGSAKRGTTGPTRPSRRSCAELNQPYRAVALAAYWTACRKGEIRVWQWQHIDLDQQIVLIPEAKSGTPRRVPLAKPVCDALLILSFRREREWPTSPWVFTLDGEKPLSEWTFRSAWERACEAAGTGSFACTACATRRSPTTAPLASGKGSSWQCQGTRADRSSIGTASSREAVCMTRSGGSKSRNGKETDNPSRVHSQTTTRNQPQVTDSKWCPGRDSNPHAPFGTRDFKSPASANFATRAGAARTRCAYSGKLARA